MTKHLVRRGCRRAAVRPRPRSPRAGTVLKGESDRNVPGLARAGSSCYVACSEIPDLARPEDGDQEEHDKDRQ